MGMGHNLKMFRLGKGLTQSDLSKKTGVKIGHISTLEKDNGDPKLSTIYKARMERFI